MSKKVSKVVRIFTALFICFAMLSGITGCAGKNEGASQSSGAKETQTAQTTAVQAGEENPFEEHMEITWLGMGLKNDSKEGNKIQKALEEKFNVTIKFPQILDYKDAEKFNLLAAAGELPDVAYIRTNISQLWDQGVLRSIPKEFIQKFSPKLNGFYDKYNGWLVNRVPGKNEEFVGIPTFTESVIPAHCSFYRYDWLQNVGIEPNGEVIQTKENIYYATEAFTLEQFEQIMKAFVYNDPDKNGKNDTIGLTSGIYNDSLLGAFGTIGKWGGIGQNYYEDGELKMWYATNAFKKYLLYMANLYKQGLIDKEFASMVDSAQKWGAQQIGWIDFGIYAVEPSIESNMAKAPANVWNTNPNAKVIMIPHEEGENGVSQYRGGGSTGSFWDINTNTVIRKEVDDKKLERILRMFDEINCDQEMSMFCLYGEAGVDYDWTGEPFKSNMTYLAGKTYPDSSDVGLGNFSSGFSVASWSVIQWQDSFAPFNNYLMTSDKNFAKKMQRDARADIFGETDIQDVAARYNPEIQVIAEKFIHEGIAGRFNIEERWDSYIKELKSVGYDKLIEELKKAPLVEYIEKGEIKY